MPVEKMPTVEQAQAMLREAASRNPGPWEQHSKLAALCAGRIAQQIPSLDAQTAYVLGLLHDIGRRYGVTGMRHIWDGYCWLSEKGYELPAKICLTHSFPIRQIGSYNGKNDCTPEETERIAEYLQSAVYTEYDRLIQLADALAYPDGVCPIEKRLIDVAIRNGINAYSVEKWKAFLALKEEFSQKIGRSIYELFEIKL